MNALFPITDIPPEYSTIADFYPLDTLLKSSQTLRIYFMGDHPTEGFGWCVEFSMIHGYKISFLYPPYMEEEHFDKFVQPLINKAIDLRREKNRRAH